MVTILMYHSIGEQNNGEIGAELYAVPEKNFRQQMEYLYQNKYSVGSLASISVDRKTKSTSNKIILTFDDVDITSFTNVLPVLEEYGFIGHFFVIAGFVNKKLGYISWEQLKVLIDAGMVIGSHGMTHRILTELKDRDLDYELRVSKEILEDNLGYSVDCLSIPRGFYNQQIIKKAKDVGYKVIFTSNIKDTDGFKLGRIAVKGSWDLKYFIRVLNSGFSLEDKTKEFMKNLSKKILGIKNYDRLRTQILK